MNFLANITRKIAQTSVPIVHRLLQKNAYSPFSLAQQMTYKYARVNRIEKPVVPYRDSQQILQRMHELGPHIKDRKPKRPLDGRPFMKGVVLKTLIKKPKKPNSANRKCVLVRLSNGKEMVAYIPGIGHNLQEHNIVLCRVGRLQDCPGVKIKCVRGKYDLGHVIKRT